MNVHLKLKEINRCEAHLIISEFSDFNSEWNLIDNVHKSWI